MKKQFFRVKQLADQRFLRAEKTEALSDDLQDAERKVDFIRTACLSAGKKLGNLSSSSGHDLTSVKEKRLLMKISKGQPYQCSQFQSFTELMTKTNFSGKDLNIMHPVQNDYCTKKNPEYMLGTSMLECASVEDDHLLRQVVTDCGKLQICLANAIVDHEMRVETNVAEPLLNVVDSDYPNIIKQKKNLSKLILDMDSAKTRYQQAMKHNALNNSAKVDSIKDELEEAEGKVEQCRDGLACEMLQLIAREAELSSIILDYAKLQRNHHVTAIAILDEIIPEMEAHINDSPVKPIFGKPLEEHLRVTGRKIAYPIELCVCGLLELGIAEEGLFRVAPGASKLRRMKLCLDANYLQFETALQYRDPHVFAGVLKSYLRELPEPLLTHKLYDQWMSASRVMSGGNQEEGLNALWNVLHNLPQANFDNLQYLVKFFSSLASNKHSNKMTPQNIAIVIAPNLIWGPNEDCNTIGMNMNVANMHSIIVDSLVTFADWFFQGDIDFYVTLSRDSVGFLNGHGGEQQDAASPDIKRTQSNDSLSDHNSPPHGSPKPAARSRKQKPTAPPPPGHKADLNESRCSSDDKATSQEQKTKPSPAKERGNIQSPHSGDEARDKKSEKKSESNKKDKAEKRTDAKESKKDDDFPPLSPSAVKPQVPPPSVPTTPPPVPPTSPPPPAPADDGKSIPSTNSVTSGDAKRPEIGFEAFHPKKDATPPSGEKKLGDLDKRTSKSGEDLRKFKATEMVYATLDRKKPPRPTPAPRISLAEISSSQTGASSEVKPAIPERPAVLQRPLSSSFRIVRPGPDSSNVEGEARTLERAHVFTLDKQQVAYIQVPSDKVPNDKKSVEPEKKECGDKPEKPKKPDSLLGQSGHQRAASEGSIIDTALETVQEEHTDFPHSTTTKLSIDELHNREGFSAAEKRPPRPTPPPPPTTSAASSPVKSPTKEDTHL